MSTDATRIADITQYGTILWSGLFQMTLAFISLYQLIGWQMFVGVGVMVLSFPINAIIARSAIFFGYRAFSGMLKSSEQAPDPHAESTNEEQGSENSSNE